MQSENLESRRQLDQTLFVKTSRGYKNGRVGHVTGRDLVRCECNLPCSSRAPASIPS